MQTVLIYLADASLVFLCVILLALFTYVSMRILALQVNYQYVNNV